MNLFLCNEMIPSWGESRKSPAVHFLYFLHPVCSVLVLVAVTTEIPLDKDIKILSVPAGNKCLANQRRAMDRWWLTQGLKQWLLTGEASPQGCVNKFQGGAPYMESLINTFTNKHICFYTWKKSGGFETMDNYLEAWKKRWRTTDIKGAINSRTTILCCVKPKLCIQDIYFT